jgi:hypothetical protein
LRLQADRSMIFPKRAAASDPRRAFFLPTRMAA